MHDKQDACKALLNKCDLQEKEKLNRGSISKSVVRFRPSLFFKDSNSTTRTANVAKNTNFQPGGLKTITQLLINLTLSHFAKIK
jgi:hypothetical protein